MAEIDLILRNLIPISEMMGGDEKDAELLNSMAADAERYLRSFPWCKDIRDIYFGDGYGGVIAIFCFHIEPEKSTIDEWLWVVSCDISPAYFVLDICKSAYQVLELYIDEIACWITLANDGRSSNEIIPVYIKPTAENAMRVAKQLEVLKTTILPSFRNNVTST